MKEIKIRCIAFTDDCIREKALLTNILNKINKSLERIDVTLIFLHRNINHFISNQVINSLFSKQNTYKFIDCEQDNKSWKINCSTEKELVLDKNFSFKKIIKIIQKKYSISSEQTITVGASEAHLNLNNISFLHFYLGDENNISHKIRRLVPLTGQYELGLLNIISYFSNLSFNDRPIKIGDLIDFIRKSKEFYSLETAAYEILLKHKAVAESIKHKFSNEIVAIFGTGYPFYLLDNSGNINSRTPNSILNYLEEQELYFRGKSLNEKFFSTNKKNNYTLEELNKNNIIIKRNKFDVDNYEKMGYDAPALNLKSEICLEDYYLNNCFDISNDIWPCYYCSTLQNVDLFPNQSEIKDTNISCLSCKQTSFMLRNIMGSCTDIDMLIVVDKNKDDLAKKIKDFIINESSYHFYDTKFHETFQDNDGPLDLFVTQTSDLLVSLKNLLTINWIDTSLNTIALWSPSINHKFHIGIDFPLAFETIFVRDENINQKLIFTKKCFLQQNTIEMIISSLRKASFYTEQLLSNQELVEIVSNKLKYWN